jgi:hypothetical protein
MSHSASTPPRHRRGGRNRSQSNEHGSRDQHQRQRFQRDTETFQRPKGGPKLTAWQKFLSIFGLGPKPPLRRAERPGPATAAEPTRPPRPQGSGEPRPPREPREAREPREPREPKTTRPVIQHEVISGRLYVGNLSYDVTEADLTNLFGGVGQVKNVEIVVNRATQRSKGFAFVEMLSIDQAKRAVTELHDKEYMGRKMLVTGAKEPEAPRPGENEAGPSESRPSESRPFEARERRESREPREFREPREPREFREPRESRAPRESRPTDDPSFERSPRREARPAPGPLAGDVTTGIIRREQLAGGVVPPAGPVSLPAVTPVATTTPTEPAASATETIAEAVAEAVAPSTPATVAEAVTEAVAEATDAAPAPSTTQA